MGCSFMIDVDKTLYIAVKVKVKVLTPANVWIHVCVMPPQAHLRGGSRNSGLGFICIKMCVWGWVGSLC